MRWKNLFADIPASLDEELVEELARGDNVHIERIVSHGQRSPDGFWYDQPEDEWVILLRGRARLLFQGEPEARSLGPGDYVSIPAHRLHRVQWTDPQQATVWLAVHYC